MLRFGNVRETRLYVFESVIRTWRTIPHGRELSWLTQTIDANAGEMSGDDRVIRQHPRSLVSTERTNAREEVVLAGSIANASNQLVYKQQ